MATHTLFTRSIDVQIMLPSLLDLLLLIGILSLNTNGVIQSNVVQYNVVHAIIFIVLVLQNLHHEHFLKRIITNLVCTVSTSEI